MREISALITEAIKTPSKPASNQHLSIGHIAVLEDDSGNIKSFEIVGYGESNLTSTPLKIEYCAPIVVQFLGASVGATAEVQITGVIKYLTLTEIKEAQNVHSH